MRMFSDAVGSASCTLYSDCYLTIFCKFKTLLKGASTPRALLVIQAAFDSFLFMLRLLDLDNVDFSEGRVIDQTLANATVADLTRLLS